MAYRDGSRITTDGLVLVLDAADKTSYPGSGTVWYDISGTTTSGSFTNGPTFSSANGGVVVFDGADDYVTLGTPTQLNGLQVPLTITSWVRLNTASGLRTIYGAYKNVSGGQLYCMIRVDSGTLKYYTSTSSGGYQSFGTFTPSLNVWSFIAVTVSGVVASSTATLYLNNRAESTALSALVTNPDSTVDLRVGGNQATSNEVWSGNISSIQIYNRALSSAEVTQNYNAQKGRFGLV